jgi:hypothetical protein
VGTAPELKGFPAQRTADPDTLPKIVNPPALYQDLYVLNIGKFCGGPYNLTELGGVTFYPGFVVLKLLTETDISGISPHRGGKEPGSRWNEGYKILPFLFGAGPGNKGAEAIHHRGI